MRRRVAFVALSAVLGAACSKDRTTAPAPAGNAGRPSPATTTSARPTSAASALEERAVKSLVEAWLAAQNDGDFAAYERLYAPRFTGVKRAGNRETSYDRDGWLADRKSRFTRPYFDCPC